MKENIIKPVRLNGNGELPISVSFDNINLELKKTIEGVGCNGCSPAINLYIHSRPQGVADSRFEYIGCDGCVNGKENQGFYVEMVVVNTTGSRRLTQARCQVREKLQQITRDQS